MKTKAAGGDVHDEKMSKSIGNVRNIADLLTEFSGQTIRLFVLSTHYRRPLDFSDEQVQNADKSLQTFHRLFERIARLTGQNVYESGDTLARMDDLPKSPADEEFVREMLGERVTFYEMMDDDFNTAGAVAALHASAGVINRYVDATKLETVPDNVGKQLVAGAAERCSRPDGSWACSRSHPSTAAGRRWRPGWWSC